MYKTNLNVLTLAMVQWFVAFSDNVVKSAFGFFITYQGFDLFSLPTNVGLMIGALVFVCPYFLFSGISGVLSDQYAHAKIIHWTRAAEIPLVMVASLTIYFEIISLLLACLFVYSIQTTLYTIATLAYLPKLADHGKLVSANAMIQSAALIGVLSGLIFGGLMIGNGYKLSLILILVLASIAGYTLSNFLPVIKPNIQPSWRVEDLNPVATAANALKAVFENPQMGLVATSITWFWLTGLILTSILPELAKEQLNVSANTANMLIASFVVGVGLGSYCISKLSRNVIPVRYVPFAALGMAIFCAELSFAVDAFAQSPRIEVLEIVGFVKHLEGIRIIIDLALLATCGAIFLAPLYSVIQILPTKRGKAVTLSGSVTLDALCSTIAAGVLAILFAYGLTINWLLLGLSAVNIIVAILIWSCVKQIQICICERD